MRLRIRELRLEKQMTLKELGDQIGRKPHSVWDYEHHKTRIPASVLYAIAQALGVSMNDLCTDDEAPVPTPPRRRERSHACPVDARRASPSASPPRSA
jgi:transcriptional regulator with XRE-family HTH domain